MRYCPYCSKYFKNLRAFRIHLTKMHKDHSNEEVFINDNKNNNNNNNNGNGYEEIKQDVAELKDTVEEIKWGLRGYINVKKRKKMTEEELTESRGNFADCISELKEKFEELDQNKTSRLLTD